MILVTGGTGFVGSSIVKKLIAKKIPVKILLFEKTQKNLLGKVAMMKGDVRDQKSLEKAMLGVDTLIHLVAIIREKGEQKFNTVNFGGTKNVVSVAKKLKVKKIIHFSALGTKFDRRFPYLYSKWLGEQEVLKSGLPHTVFKPSIIFGQGDQFTNRLAQIVKISPLFPVLGDGKVRFQPIWVDDVAEGVIKTLENQKYDQQVLEIGGPQILTYEEICDTIIKALGKKRIKIHLPLSLMKFLVWPMQILPESSITPVELSMLSLDNTTDEKSVEKYFGFKPHALKEKVGYLLSN